MRKKCITAFIGVVTTWLALKFSTEYMAIVKNKMSLLQLNNNNSDYIKYKTFIENGSLINLMILIIGILVTFIIIKNMRDKKESK